MPVPTLPWWLTYCACMRRWLTYRALHRAVMAVLERHLRRTRLLPMLFRFLGAYIE